MRGQEQRRELKNYTVHYNSATNEQGQPRSGEQNGDVMMEVIEKVWEDQVKDAANRKIKEVEKKRREALQKKRQTQNPRLAEMITIPTIPNRDDLLNKELPENFLPPYWFTWLLYGPLAANPDEDVSFTASNGPDVQGVGGGGLSDDDDEDYYYDDDNFDCGGGGGGGSSSSGSSGGGGGGGFEDGESSAGSNASASSSGEGNPSKSSGDTGEGKRRKLATTKAAKMKGKKKANSSGGASGGSKSAVRSKHAMKVLSSATEVLGRRATKERDREEKKKARGEAAGMAEQLKISRESSAALLKVTQQVALISGTLEQAAKADQRKDRLLELDTTEKLYRQIGQNDKADAAVAEGLAILESPMAPVFGRSGTGAAGVTTSGGVGMAEGVDGGAGGGEKSDTVDVDFTGCTNGNRSDNAVSDEAASLRAGAGQVARNHARATGGPESKATTGAAAKYYASLRTSPSRPAADVWEVNSSGSDADAGGNQLGMDVDGGRGARGDASGGSAGRGFGGGGEGVGGGGGPKKPQCDKHRVPCKLMKVKGTTFWVCGLDDVFEMCDYFEAADGVSVDGEFGGASEASAGATAAAAKDTRGGSSVGSAGSGFGAGGEGAGAGGGPKPPQCKKHGIPWWVAVPVGLHLLPRVPLVPPRTVVEEWLPWAPAPAAWGGFMERRPLGVLLTTRVPTQ
ncbi:unnamed protein product [Ectocarpus sp. CCAP 1310/34]|nr:unnamed protein product [Ectocarpus sp. CCAP 1310/34]